jgi:hypothetical protein
VIPEDLLNLLVQELDPERLDPELRDEVAMLILDHVVFSGDDEGREAIAEVVAGLETEGSPLAAAAKAVANSTWDLVQVVPKGKDGRVRLKSLTKGPLHAVDLPAVHEVDVDDQMLVRLVACPGCTIAIPLLLVDEVTEVLPDALITDIAWGKPTRDEALRTLRVFLLAILRVFADLPEDADEDEIQRRLAAETARLNG